MIQHGLGRIPSQFDARDFNLSAFIPKFKLTLITEKAWEFPLAPLDQGNTPHCCGFSIANFLINYPVTSIQTNANGDAYYYACKTIDKESKKENGSSIRSVARLLTSLGRIKYYAFAYDLATVKWWLLNRSPLIVGTIWLDGMNTPDKNNIIIPIGNLVGGHAYLLNEWRKDNMIGIQNSWGDSWGNHGKAYISASNFERLLRSGGEVMAAVEISQVKKQGR